jgi:hypothetical protein
MITDGLIFRFGLLTRDGAIKLSSRLHFSANPEDVKELTSPLATLFCFLYRCFKARGEPSLPIGDSPGEPIDPSTILCCAPNGDMRSFYIDRVLGSGVVSVRSRGVEDPT